VGIASGNRNKRIASKPGPGLSVFQGRIPAVFLFKDGAEPGADQITINTASVAEGMGAYGRSAGGPNMAQYLFGAQPEGEIFIRAEKQKVSLPGGVFLADNHHQPVALHSLGYQLPCGHGVVVGDAYPVQTLFLGLMDNVVQGHIAAGRNATVDVEIK
jgi:hypothetical protein